MVAIRCQEAAERTRHQAAKLGPKLLPKKSHPTMIDHMKEMINNIHMATHGDNGGSDDDSDDSDSDWGDSDDD